MGLGTLESGGVCADPLDTVLAGQSILQWANGAALSQGSSCCPQEWSECSCESRHLDLVVDTRREKGVNWECSRVDRQTGDNPIREVPDIKFLSFGKRADRGIT
jgi:hypothetical protein